MTAMTFGKGVAASLGRLITCYAISGMLALMWGISCLGHIIPVYGCEFWYLDDSKIIEFCTAWRKGLRRIWNLPSKHTVIYCIVCPMIYLYLMKYADNVWCLLNCLHHNNGIERIFCLAWYYMHSRYTIYWYKYEIMLWSVYM